jgi:hypothetical protein
LIVPVISSEKPYARVCFAAVMVKIFLTVIFLPEETDSESLSKRLPPIAAETK